MRYIPTFFFSILFAALALSSCSIAPDKNISKNDLLRSRGASLYIIEDDIDGVLKILNDKGEVVVNSTRFDDPVYLQIFATPEGIEVRQFDKNEYNFDE